MVLGKWKSRILRSTHGYSKRNSITIPKWRGVWKHKGTNCIPRNVKFEKTNPSKRGQKSNWEQKGSWSTSIGRPGAISRHVITVNLQAKLLNLQRGIANSKIEKKSAASSCYNVILAHGNPPAGWSRALFPLKHFAPLLTYASSTSCLFTNPRGMLIWPVSLGLPKAFNKVTWEASWAALAQHRTSEQFK